MVLAFSQPPLWSALLSQFFHVYTALETALVEASAKAENPRVGALHRNFFARLARSDAFLADVRTRAAQQRYAI